MPRLNIFLALVLIAVSVATWLGRRDFTQRNMEFLPDMAHSPAYGAFDSNPNFPDGKTLQVPVAGTVSRGELPLHYDATAGDAARAGRELHSPIAGGDDAAVQQGAAAFAIFCQHCHGAGGLGNGPVAKRGFPPPPPLIAAHAVGLQDGQVFHIITYGQGNMPGHAGQVSRDERWRVIAYLRALQSRAGAVSQQPSATSQPASQGAQT